MKQKLFIFFFLILLVGVLIGLNAATYVQREKTPDSEIQPNRSTYNSGATGTQAFYTLLSETGRKVTRWQEPPSALLTSKSPPAVFVVIGSLRREFTDQEAHSVLRWTSNGGRLVIIDREPPTELVKTTSNWHLDLTMKPDVDLFTIDPADRKQMIGETVAVKPVQPTLYTQGVNAVQPSKFAASVTFSKSKTFTDTDSGVGVGGAAQRNDEPPPRVAYDAPPPSELAPVVHFGSSAQNLVVEAPYGSGKILFLSDPYLVSNNGISLVDNAQLGINLVSAGSSTVAFDEYHQSYGSDNNRFLEFFAGTPVVAIFLHSALLIALVFYSQSRRFARAVPEPEADRLSKLEYVAAMAELQGRARAFDLAIENIYAEFRRRAARLFGLDIRDATCDKLAPRISERTGLDNRTVYDTLYKCEDIIRGEPTNRREIVRLTEELRALEKKLGIIREVKRH
ncbi:MAG: DUF4350 domain-containing protein [Pyrinomonadaceae bacterium]